VRENGIVRKYGPFQGSISFLGGKEESIKHAKKKQAFSGLP
jgi:hypothetical protein